MSALSTTAILLRRIQHGDNDLILTLFTAEAGKVSVIAKHAKKSSKRFAGVLELFSEVRAVYKQGRGGLPVLQEAALVSPHERIRADIRKTATASFWAEIINVWIEEGKPQEELYRLIAYALGALDQDRMGVEETSILFLARFLKTAGLSPRLDTCVCCRTELDDLPGSRVSAEIPKGGITCSGCKPQGDGWQRLSKGTLKKLIWVGAGELPRAERIRFNAAAVKEGLLFLELFVSYHLGGRELKSLRFLREIRKSSWE